MRSVLVLDMLVIIWVYRSFLAWLSERQLWGTREICIHPRWRPLTPNTPLHGLPYIYGNANEVLKSGYIEFKYYADAIHSDITPPASFGLKEHYIEFKYYADGIHSGLTPPG